MKSSPVALVVATLFLNLCAFNACADDTGIWNRAYVAGGGGTRGANAAIGGGNQTDALEISGINLGRVSGNSTAKFMGVSLVQNATPKNGFGLLFRVGIGKAITRFDSGVTATRMGLTNGIFFGIGEQYQANKYLAFRVEAYRITYASTPDGNSMGVRYPVTLSAVLAF